MNPNSSVFQHLEEPEDTDEVPTPETYISFIGNGKGWVYENVERYEEYYRNNHDFFEIIKGYVHIILLLIKRHFSHTRANFNDVNLSYKVLVEFETILLESLEKTELIPDYANPRIMHLG